MLLMEIKSLTGFWVQGIVWLLVDCGDYFPSVVIVRMSGLRRTTLKE